jgi:carbon-monoxide dehydrogenase medium subunit
VNHLPELAGVAADSDAVTIGACVTHAAIADEQVPDIGNGLLAHVAETIAYRAIRNRGTIGGSLCHADPAADWVTVLIALDASVLLQGPEGTRSLRVNDFIQGAFRTALRPGEIMRAIHVPRLQGFARWGFEKVCRKPGDFALAMAAVLLSPDRHCAVIGALGGKPLRLENDAVSLTGATRALEAVSKLDPVRRRMQLVVFNRALAKAHA